MLEAIPDAGSSKARRRPGRPRRVESELADQRVWSFFTKSEKEAAKRIAKRDGVELAEFIRDAVNDYVESIGENRIIATGNSRRTS
jgi:hypothetical protein